MFIGRSNVSKYALVIRSPPALDAEYGLFGCSGVVSEKYPVSPNVPYTSSVDIWMYFSTPNSFAAFKRTCVPKTLDLMNISGSVMLLSTWLSAAKLMT